MRVGGSKKFADHLRTLRRERNLTQDALAERSGLSVDWIRRMERGALSPTLGSLEKLSVGLGVSLVVLFAPFEPAGTTEEAQIRALLVGRSPRELRVAYRVLRALFESPDAPVATRLRSKA
jgi:transcriptional regulator with XRE-family HTH domain